MDSLSEALQIGDHVELHGLSNAAELNGRTGRIICFVRNASRFGVKLDGSDESDKEQKLVKPSNLRKLPLEAPAPALPARYWDPIPAAFMETTIGTPVFKVLLQFLPVEPLLALSCCQASLRAEVHCADQAWERLVSLTFGGSVAVAQRRCPAAAGSLSSPRAAFLALAALRRALGQVKVVRGDLRNAASLGVDCAVCPAVPPLQPYGPTAAAVYEEAGEELTEHLQKMPELQVGEACWTPGFSLGTRGLVHAVGPTHRSLDADGKLRKVYAAALACVKEHGHDSVAFGSISTGGNGIKPQLAAQIAAEEFRTFLAQPCSQGELVNPLRLVVVAFEAHIEHAFRRALDKIRQRVNEELLEVLPLLALDSMLPLQHLEFKAEDLPVAVPPNGDRFAMVGIDFRPRANGMRNEIMTFGVEVNVVNRRSVAGSSQLEVVGGRRFSMPGHPNQLEASDPQGRPYLAASVNWASEEEEEPNPGLLQQSAELEPLVNHWLTLVRAGRERQVGQMDLILKHLGPMPAAAQISERAFWIAALINPLPGLGVAFEIRPAMLEAECAARRLKVAHDGLISSIANLDGTEPLRPRR